MTNIEDLRGRVRVLLDLLENPEPGLFTWREAYEKAAAHVLSFWDGGPISIHAGISVGEHGLEIGGKPYLERGND